jgi:hypothetical protein
MTLVSEDSRVTRAVNIATIILEVMASSPSSTMIPAKNLRDEIRKRLKLPKLEGEKRHGDNRGHGDALGKHCLDLDTEWHNEERMVLLNDANKRKCEKFVDDYERESKIFRF